MEKIVRVEIATMPNSRRDVKNSTGKTTKLMKGASLGIAPPIDKHRRGQLKTGTTREEFSELFPGEDYDTFFKKLYLRLNTDGKTLYLDEPIDMIYYNLLKVTPWACMNIEDYNPLVHSVIVTDEEAKAEARVKVADRKMQAYIALNEMSSTKKRKFLYLYGIVGAKASDSIVSSKLLEKVESDPDRFLKLFNDTNKEERILLKTLLSQAIIRKNGTAFFYGDEGDAVTLGANEELAVEYLKNPKNQELKEVLLIELEEQMN